MCGIFGQFMFQNKMIQSSVLDTAGKKMWYRGPDDISFWNDNSAEVGMVRLAVTDPDGPGQPVCDENRRAVLVFNGELYNHKQLRDELEALGWSFQTRGDAEVLLKAYLAFGRECLTRLNGMYAFAVYDLRNGELWLVRDSIGIKPLYYFYDFNRLVFASDALALAKATGGILDESSIYKYLAHSFVPGRSSMFKGIYKVLPGEQLVASANSLEFRQSESASETCVQGEQDEVQSLAEALGSAVRLESDLEVPAGILLSGGTDSSVLAQLVCNATGNAEIASFTASFEGKESNDAAEASKLAAKLGLRHTEVTINKKMHEEYLAELIMRLDEPFADSAAVTTYLLSSKARAEGLKVLFSGAGVDEIFGGYPRHFPEIPFQAAWVAASPIRRFFMSALAMCLFRHHRYRFGSEARNYGAQISGISLKFLSAIFRTKSDWKKVTEVLDNDYRLIVGKGKLDRVAYDFRNYLVDNILAIADKASMAASIENRVPYLNKIFVAGAMKNEKSKLIKTINKDFFKEVARSSIGSAPINRRKEGFNSPINVWYANRKSFDSVKLNAHPQLQRILKLESNPPDINISYGQTIYALRVLNLWLQTHIADDGSVK